MPELFAFLFFIDLLLLPLPTLRVAFTAVICISWRQQRPFKWHDVYCCFELPGTTYVYYTVYIVLRTTLCSTHEDVHV